MAVESGYGLSKDLSMLAAELIYCNLLHLVTPTLKNRLVTEYRMIRMLDFLQEYAKYMHLYEYWMHICLYVCMFLLRLLPPQPP